LKANHNEKCEYLAHQDAVYNIKDTIFES